MPDSLILRLESAIRCVTVAKGCGEATKDLIVDRSVTGNATYLKGTAKGEGTDRIFSVDGKTFGRFDDLRVAGADGAPRPAVAEDIKAIRRKFNVSLEPGQSTEIHFHVRTL